MNATHTRSKILVGLTAAVGSLSAAAMVSTASAPTARADDFTDIVAAVDGDFTQGGLAFSSALSDFGSNDVSQGLAQLVDGLDDYSLSPVYNLTVGTVDALEGEPIGSSLAFGISVPTDFADGLTLAQEYVNSGDYLLNASITLLASGDYAQSSIDLTLGTDYLTAIPLEELIIGTLASL